MNSFKLYAGISSCLLAMAGLGGCCVTTEPAPIPETIPNPGTEAQTGVVTVSWTVEGSHSAPACTQLGAYDLQLVITNSLHRPVTTVNAPCSDFSLAVRLPAGNTRPMPCSWTPAEATSRPRSRSTISASSRGRS